jgi:CP family cyanate transporter-like MFS transporter
VAGHRGLAGALYAPLDSAAAWVLILGIRQGAALALAIFFTIARAPDPVSAASLSSLAQAAGYLVASAGPLELGLLHSATGSWDLPVAVLFVLNGCLFAAGVGSRVSLALNRPAACSRTSGVTEACVMYLASA